MNGVSELYLREPRRFRAVRIDPGNVTVECLTCCQRIYGVTAHDTLETFKLHDRTEHSTSGDAA